MITDIHRHFVPPEFFKFVKRRDEFSVTVKRTEGDSIDLDVRNIHFGLNKTFFDPVHRSAHHHCADHSTQCHRNRRSCRAHAAFVHTSAGLACGAACYVGAFVWLSGRTNSGAALATLVGVLIEVPVMLSVVKIVNSTRGWYEAGAAVRRVGSLKA